jgi:hypothetical protein
MLEKPAVFLITMFLLEMMRFVFLGPLYVSGNRRISPPPGPKKSRADLISGNGLLALPLHPPDELAHEGLLRTYTVPVAVISEILATTRTKMKRMIILDDMNMDRGMMRIVA